MKKIYKYSIILTLILMFSFSVVLGDPLSDSLEKQKQDIEQNKSKLQIIQTEKLQLEKQIEQMDNKIVGLIFDIKSNNDDINSMTIKVNESQDNINKKEKQVAGEQELYNKRIKAMYINGLGGYIEAVITADGISKMIENIDLVGRIIEFDKRLLANMNKDIVELTINKENLEKQIKDLKDLKINNESELSKLNTTKADQKKLFGSLKEKENLLVGVVNESQNKISSILKEIEDAKKKIIIPQSSSGIIALDNPMVAYSVKFLGISYLWGGTNPITGFDCSGLTQYVYNFFGVIIGRTTYDQIKDGNEVLMKDLQPGDLIFFGTWSDPHHVGMYIGNGAYIHAPKTGDVVKISLLSDRDDYLTSRRVNAQSNK